MSPGANAPLRESASDADSAASGRSFESEDDSSLSEAVARALDSVSPSITVASWAASSTQDEEEEEEEEELGSADDCFSATPRMMFGPAMLRRKRRLQCHRGRRRVRRLCVALCELWLVALAVAWGVARAGVRCGARALPLAGWCVGRCAARALAQPLALAQLLALGGAVLAARALDSGARVLRSPAQACVSAALTACAPAALCFLCARGACSCARACACACACEVPAGACGAVGLSACACVELCLCEAPAAVCALPERFAFCALRDARRLLRKYAPRWPATPPCPCGRLRSRLAQEDT